MYKCINCNNIEDFKEIYKVENIVKISNWENINSYDNKSDLIEVLCLKCWDSTEDENITINWEIL